MELSDEDAVKRYIKEQIEPIKKLINIPDVIRISFSDMKDLNGVDETENILHENRKKPKWEDLII